WPSPTNPTFPPCFGCATCTACRWRRTSPRRKSWSGRWPGAILRGGNWWTNTSRVWTMGFDQNRPAGAMDEGTLLSLAWHIVGRLEERGWRAWLVGGCVRDRLLGRPLKDVDIATSARPEDVMALFERTEPTGLAHGTVTVILRGRPFEVTTLRTEGGYSDGRRPDEVRFI